MPTSLCSAAYVLVLASSHLVITSTTYPCCLLLQPAPPVILVVSELFGVQVSLWSCNSVILWFRDPVILRSWVCQSSWESSFLWVLQGWVGSRALGLLKSQVQTGMNLCLLLVSLCFPGFCGGPRCTGCWERCCGLNCDLECIRGPVLLGVSDLLGVKLPLWSCDPVILDTSKHLGVRLSLSVLSVSREPAPLISWEAGCAGSNWDPGFVRVPGSRASSGCSGTGCRASSQGLLRAQLHTQMSWLYFLKPLFWCQGHSPSNKTRPPSPPWWPYI
jgi:hypothetical protein